MIFTDKFKMYVGVIDAELILCGKNFSNGYHTTELLNVPVVLTTKQAFLSSNEEFNDYVKIELDTYISRDNIKLISYSFKIDEEKFQMKI